MDNGCLAIIAFSAGAELQLGDVRRIKKQVRPCTCMQMHMVLRSQQLNC